MTENGESRFAQVIQQLIPWTTALLVIAALYAGWVFFWRYQQTRDEEREAQEKQAKYDRDILDRLGGSSLGVLNFYASPAAIHPGTHVSLCYGVSNAKSVTIEPDLGSWKPALSRCIDVEPRRTTRYTLTAKNAKGASVTATTEVVVK